MWELVVLETVQWQVVGHGEVVLRSTQRLNHQVKHGQDAAQHPLKKLQHEKAIKGCWIKICAYLSDGGS